MAWSQTSQKLEGNSGRTVGVKEFPKSGQDSQGLWHNMMFDGDDDDLEYVSVNL